MMEEEALAFPARVGHTMNQSIGNCTEGKRLPNPNCMRIGQCTDGDLLTKEKIWPNHVDIVVSVATAGPPTNDIIADTGAGDS